MFLVRRRFGNLALLAALVVTALLAAAGPVEAGNDCDERYPDLREELEAEREAFKDAPGYRVEKFKERCARLDFFDDRRRIEGFFSVMAFGFLGWAVVWFAISLSVQHFVGENFAPSRAWLGGAAVALFMVMGAGALVDMVLQTLFGTSLFTAGSINPPGG